MQIATIAGNVGKDAELKSTNDGTPYCRFSVAVSTGWGDRKATTWWDVTRWGKSAEKLAPMLTKGTKVTASGEVSTREHEGKTYLQLRADHVRLQGDKREATTGTDNRAAPRSQPPQTGGAGFGDDLDDHIPFITASPCMEPGARFRRVM